MHKSNHIWFNQNCFPTSLNWIAFFVSTENGIYTLKQIVEQNLKSCKKFLQISTWGWFITISCKYNNTLTSTNYKGVNEVSVLKYFWIFCFYVIHIKMKITVKINTSKWNTLHFMLFSTTAKGIRIERKFRLRGTDILQKIHEIYTMKDQNVLSNI